MANELRTSGDRQLTVEEQELKQSLLDEIVDYASRELNVLGIGPEIYDLEKISEACDFACFHHRDQRRKSGEAFVTHPIDVAKICVSMRLDTDAIVAALLHDTVEDTAAELSEIKAYFGGVVAELVDGVTKLDNLQFNRDEAQAENYRKMIIAVTKDVRVVLLKLADRLHNARSFEVHKRPKQIELAKETLEVYAPLAHRFGVHAIKWELEDLSLATLHPRKYQEIKSLVSQQRDEREKFLADASDVLEKSLKSAGMKAEISGRAKHFYSIYIKMTRKGREFNEIYDLTGMRVTVDEQGDCYNVLGVIHALWKPVPGRFKDYIGVPKSNFYQSLHTTVVGPGGRPLEIQIRTREMHAIAEYGVAAHWLYKQAISDGKHSGGKRQKSGAKLLKVPKNVSDEAQAKAELTKENEESLKWIASLLDSGEANDSPQAFMDRLRSVLSQEDEVYIFTPTGSVLKLELGSTPIDYAYEVHTDIGHRCVGAKVNNKMVPLTYQLKSGDMVEILTSKKERGPSRDWLKVAKTSRAQSKIKAWFKAEGRADNEHHGRELLQEQLRRAGLPAQRLVSSPLLADVTNELGFKKADDFYIALGSEKISARVVVKKLIQRLKEGEDADDVQPSAVNAILRPSVVSRQPTGSASSYGIQVDGAGDVMLRIAKCCRPVPGDPIVGYVSLGRGITVHRSDCRNAEQLGKDQDRFVQVDWEGAPVLAFKAELLVEAYDRHRLLEDITRTFAETGANVVSANCRSNGPMVRNKFVVEVGDTKTLKSVLSKLRQIDDVFDAYRITPEG